VARPTCGLQHIIGCSIYENFATGNVHITINQRCAQTDTPHQQLAVIAKLCACAGVVQLLNSGHLPHDFWDWDFSAGFSWGLDADEEEAQPAEAAAGKHRC